MMKRLIASVLAVFLLLPTAAALGADTGESVRVISFGQLEQLVSASNPDMTALKQAYETQKLILKDMKSQHSDLMQSSAPLESIAAVAIPLQKEISAMEIVLAYEERDLSRTLRQQVYLAQSQYLMYYSYDLEIQLAELELKTANQALTRLQGQYRAGYAAYSQVEAMAFAVRDKESALSALKLRQQSGMTSLALTLGLSERFSLAGAADIDLSGIPERDLAADCAAYLEGAPNVRRSVLALEDAERGLKNANTQATRYAVQAAKENLAFARSVAELEFPQVYQSLLQAYSEYMDASRVEAAQKKLRSAERQWKLGIISANQLAAAKQAYDTEALNRQKQMIEVCRSLMEYELYLF